MSPFRYGGEGEVISGGRVTVLTPTCCHGITDSKNPALGGSAHLFRGSLYWNRHDVRKKIYFFSTTTTTKNNHQYLTIRGCFSLVNKLLTCNIYLCTGSVDLTLTVFIVDSKRKLWRSLYRRLKKCYREKEWICFCFVLSIWGSHNQGNYYEKYGRSTMQETRDSRQLGPVMGAVGESTQHLSLLLWTSWPDKKNQAGML